MKLTATLFAIYSERDRNGNCYWALRFIDHETGREVHGTVCGGESNIYGILRHWNNPNDWDRSIQFHVQGMKKRDFARLTQGWAYAGCGPEDLAEFIRAELAKPIDE